MQLQCGYVKFAHDLSSVWSSEACVSVSYYIQSDHDRLKFTDSFFNIRLQIGNINGCVPKGLASQSWD